MAKFKYLGPDNVLVGRFGRLKHGQTVELWQSEAEYILSRGSDGWEQLIEEPDLAGVGSVLPCDTRIYNLTRIHWDKGALFALRNKNRGELVEIGRAMNSLGAKLPIDPLLHRMSRETLAETIYGEVVRLRWNQAGYTRFDRNEKPPTDLPILPPPAPKDDIAEMKEDSETEEAPISDQAPETVAEPAPEPKPAKAKEAPAKPVARKIIRK